MAYILKLFLIIETFDSYLKTVPSWSITQRVVAMLYRRFGTAYQYQLTGYRMHVGGNFKGKEYKKLDS